MSTLLLQPKPLLFENIDLSEDDSQAEDDSWFENTGALLFGEDVDISGDGAPNTGFLFEVAEDSAFQNASDSDAAFSSYNDIPFDQDVDIDFEDHADDTIENDGEEDAEPNFGDFEDPDPNLVDLDVENYLDFDVQGTAFSHSVSDFCLRAQALEDSDPALFAKFVLTGEYANALSHQCQAVVKPLRNALDRNHPITALRNYDSLLSYVADLPIVAPIYVSPVGNTRKVLRRSVYISLPVDTADVSLFVMFLKRISDLLAMFRALKWWTFIGSRMWNLDPGAKETLYGYFSLGFMTGIPTPPPS